MNNIDYRVYKYLCDLHLYFAKISNSNKRLQFPQKTLHSFKALFSYNTSEPWFKQNYCHFHSKVPIVAMLVLLLTWITYA